MYQNIYLEKSISLATKISTSLAKNSNLKNRGVKQAGFVILRKASMPSVLIETGFMTNKEDETFLHLKEGQKSIANSICDALASYKNEMEYEISEIDDLNEKAKMALTSMKNSPLHETLIYRVQLLALEENTEIFIPDNFAMHAIDLVYENGLKKLIAGKFSNYDEALQFKEQLKETQFKEAFVVAYRGEQRIGLNKANRIKQSQP